jgi:hypothetical protein
MIDNTNPTNQFHPYQPPEDLIPPPARNGLRGLLRKARIAAGKNPGPLLGGLAAVAIGAGLLRRKRVG